MVRSTEQLFRIRLPGIISTAVNLSPETVRSLFDQCVTTAKQLLALTLFVSVNGQQDVEEIYERLLVSKHFHGNNFPTRYDPSGVRVTVCCFELLVNGIGNFEKIM